MSRKLTPKSPSKSEIIHRLVRRSKGARLCELETATGWKPHSIRAAMSGLRKQGPNIECVPDVKGGSRYRLVKDRAQ